MPLHFTSKNDPSGFLALYRTEINSVLSQVPMNTKKKLIQILRDTIDEKCILSYELDDLEYELFPEEYAENDDNYPQWYLDFRNQIVWKIFDQKSIIYTDVVNSYYDEAHAKDLYNLEEYNRRKEKQRRLSEEFRIIDECKDLELKKEDGPPPF